MRIFKAIKSWLQELFGKDKKAVAKTPPPDPYLTKKIDTLARTLYGEARGEGFEGMAAVACVVINRVSAPCWWGSDIISVCRKYRQFSCWNENDPNLEVIRKVDGSYLIFSVALQIAESAIKGKLKDKTGGANHYYRQGTPEPDWAKGKTPVAKIGNHLFFKL